MTSLCGFAQDRTKTTGGDETLVVQNLEEQQAAETEGWRTTPAPTGLLAIRVLV